MSDTFEMVANLIVEIGDVDREAITPAVHAIDDLGIDSLDFLDIAFAIDRAFGIRIPLEQWTRDLNEGIADTADYFVMRNLCERIDALRAHAVPAS